MDRLLLIRHGETDWNRARRIQGHSDLPLNEAGRVQAERLARRLSAWPIDHLHASDLARAAETARIVGRAIGLEPILDPAWRERSGGVLEGLTDDEARERFPEVWAAMEARRFWTPPGGEAVEAVLERVAGACRALRERHRTGTVAVVSHGFALRLLVAHLMNFPLDRPTPFSTGANTGLTIVEFEESGPVVVRLNDASHLED